jgi:GNAT superfamily N-acetyltransferase
MSGLASVSARSITAAETRALRQSVLRPHQAADALVYPGDEADDTLHLGAFAEDRLVGVASVYREAMPDAPPFEAWRVRGMAVLPDWRRSGVGRELLGRALQHAHGRGGAVVWCNARSAAVPFYRAAGFEPRGEEFELPDIGPHQLMWRKLEETG